MRRRRTKVNVDDKRSIRHMDWVCEYECGGCFNFTCWSKLSWDSRAATDNGLCIHATGDEDTVCLEGTAYTPAYDYIGVIGRFTE